MRDVVRQAMARAATDGLTGNHHFFITFRTDFPGVEISQTLSTRYPKEMTIVLQHQYWELEVGTDEFGVTLSFDDVPEPLRVPFAAITAFADPSVNFGLQFQGSAAGATQPAEKAAGDTQPADDTAAAAKVVSLDTFRTR